MKKMSRFISIFLISFLFSNCYFNPVFRQALEGGVEKSLDSFSFILTLLGLSSSDFSDPTGAKVEIKFSRADGSVYANKVVASVETTSASYKSIKNSIPNVFYTNDTGKVTIYFSKLDTFYTIEIREVVGTVIARIKLRIPKNVNSSLDLIPTIEFGDVIAEILSASATGGSIPANLNYEGSPYILTKDTVISPIIPSFVGVITECVANPSLPTGLNLSNTDCSITGIPSSVSLVKTYLITGSNSFGSASNEIIISVTDSAPANLVYANAPFLFTTSVAIPIQTPTFSGSISSCSVTPVLPAGLLLDSTNCSISGTPSIVSSTENYTIIGSNSNGSASVVISITINDVPPSALSYLGTPFTFTQGLAISPATPTFSGSVTSCTSAPALPAGLIINGTNCEITGVPTNSQGITAYVITATNPYGSTTANIQITVNIAPPSSLVFAGNPFVFTQGVLIASQTPTFSGTITDCTSSPILPTGLGLNPTNCMISGTPSNIQGLTNYTITATNSSGSTQTVIGITVNIAAPSALVYIGSPFIFTQNATITPLNPSFSGSVTSCTATPALPIGLGINPTTCAITGTPSVTQGSTLHMITATNSSGSTNFEIDVTVNVAQPSGLSYAGTPFTFVRTVSIGTETPTVTGTITNCYSIPALPAGLSISTTTCALSGIPSAVQGNNLYTITASNSSGNTTANINIAVINPNCQADFAILDSCILQ